MEYQQSEVNAENMKNYTDYSYSEGWAEGLAAGHTEKKQEIIQKMKKAGMSAEEIQRILQS